MNEDLTPEQQSTEMAKQLEVVQWLMAALQTSAQPNLEQARRACRAYDWLSALQNNLELQRNQILVSVEKASMAAAPEFAPPPPEPVSAGVPNA